MKALAALLVTAACAKQDPSPPPRAKPAAAPAARVGLAVGAATFGCLGWSVKANAAACVTGEIAGDDKRVELTFVGDLAPPLTLGETLDAAMVGAANTALADYQRFATPAAKLEPGKPATAGGITLEHRVRVTDPGGPNIAPTESHEVVAICGVKEELVDSVAEQGRQWEVAYRTAGTGALVEITTHLAREGEYAHGFRATLVDGCAGP